QGVGRDHQRPQGAEVRRLEARGKAQGYGCRCVLGRRIPGDVRHHAVRYEDPALGIYKKLIIRDNRLAGVVLVGDSADSGRYMEWLRTNADLIVRRRNLLFPEPIADGGESVAEVA